MPSAARKATWLPLTAAHRRRTPAQTRLTAAVDQPSSLRAHWNSRARIARPSGMTTMLVPGTGTTRSATPKIKTLKPAIAIATLRTPGVTRVAECVPGPAGRFDISVRRICMIRLLPPFRAPWRHGLVILPGADGSALRFKSRACEKRTAAYRPGRLSPRAQSASPCVASSSSP
jgi:hypothetical protein